MKQFSDFPRVSLGILPTPLYRLPNISEAMGKNIYIKRDDMTGVALGGNKVRKLEFLIADAMAQGCDYMLTTGGAQSNHAMLTAACCDRLGLGSVLVLKKRGVWQKLGNQIINDLLGADVRFVDTDDYADVYADGKNMRRTAGQRPQTLLRASGRLCANRLTGLRQRSKGSHRARGSAGRKVRRYYLLHRLRRHPRGHGSGRKDIFPQNPRHGHSRGR